MLTELVGTCQVLSAGKPALTQTNTFFNVPLPLTTTSSDFNGADACALAHTGFAEVSRTAILGCVPSNVTLPVIVPPLSISGMAAAPPPAGAPLSADLGASVLVSPPPQLASVK